jgi:hypothetical protein
MNKYKVFVCVIIAISAFAVNASSVINFESPDYVVNSLINGQGGWTGPSDRVYVKYDSGSGSQVLDFSDVVGSMRYASKSINPIYSTGQVRIEFLMKWLGDLSGEIILKDAADNWIFSMGIGKNYLQPGLYWQIGEGPSGYITNSNMPTTIGGQRYIQISIYIDLNTNLVNVSWGELGQGLTSIFTNYAIASDASFAKLDMGNASAAAKFDDIRVNVRTCQELLNDGVVLMGDINEDCEVSFKDIEILAESWLNCNNPEDPICAKWVNPKHRIFITKIYPGHGILSSSDFRQLADAGFTAVVDRWADDLPGFIQGATSVGLDSMTWDLGLVWGSNLPRTVTYQGKQTGNAVAYSADTWSVIREMIIGRVELSLTYPAFKAVLLDFEIYDPNKTNGYAESYDDYIFVKFLTDKGYSIPSPLTPVASRRSYLDTRGLLEQFIAYQYDRVAAEVRQIRHEIDSINPYFQIGVYGWGPLIEAVKENITSEVAPVLILDAATYTRSPWVTGGYDITTPDRIALRWSMLTNFEREQVQNTKNYPSVYLGGHDPQTVGDGNLYKFTVRQAFNSYVYGSGYWVWTEWDAPNGWEKQAFVNALMAYFKESQTAIDNMDWAWSSKEPDQITDINATTPQIILTMNATGLVKAWDPLTGAATTTSAVVGPQWGTMGIGDVDTVAGNEKIILKKGWIEISDEETSAPLLKFFVGTEQARLQLINQ